MAAAGWPAGWVLLLVGTLGLSISVPLAASRFDKLGFGSPAIMWSFGTIVAVYLIARGGLELIRGARGRFAKLLALPLALVLLQFVVYPLGMAAYTTHAARPPLGERTPADLGLGYEDVSLTSADGSTLAAWYVPPSNGAVVILRHGSGSTRTAALRHAAFLADAGYGLFMMDARGHGESGGAINELGWHGPDDIHTALDHLAGLPEVTGGIGILGLSMGGEEALKAAAADDRIEVVVAEGVGIGTYDDSVALGAHAIARFINGTQYWLTERLSDVEEPISLVEAMPRLSPRSVLLIAGDQDMERDIGRVYARAGGSNVHLWELADSPHISGLRVHPDEYRARVLALFAALWRS